MFVNIFERVFTPVHSGIGDLCIKVSRSFAQMHPDYKEGDIVYIPVSLWIDANEKGRAPPVVPHSSHLSVLSHIPFNILSRHFLIK